MLAGVDPDNASLEDATDICSMMVWAGRLIPASLWVDSQVEKADRLRDRLRAEDLDRTIDSFFGV
jgi:hypothetical protein